MNPKIIDYVEGGKGIIPVPIKVVAVLQNSNKPEPEYKFASFDNYPLKGCGKIERLSILDNFLYSGFNGLSLIKCDGAIMLAEWNDGVV